jgi:hypothetical protein
MLIQLVYLSTSRHLLTDDELAEILLVSQRNNEKVDITGALIYHDGNFIQLLEGPEEAVLTLYDKIKADRRHGGVLTLVQSPIEKREFASWSMMFRNIGKLDPEILEKNSILNTPLTTENLSHHPSRALELLRSFRDTMTL